MNQSRKFWIFRHHANHYDKYKYVMKELNNWAIVLSTIAKKNIVMKDLIVYSLIYIWVPPTCKGCDRYVNEKSKETCKWWDYCNKCYEEDQEC